MTEKSYLAATVEACGRDDWKAIVEQAVAAAKKGDDRARSFLAGYLLGEPSTRAATPRQVMLEGEGLSEVDELLASAWQSGPLESEE
jgi:hypothetical protein